MTLFSFGDILWRLSGDWPLALGSGHVHIPGLMLWVAVLYALLAMWVTHVVGRCLVPINFDKLRFEADFRYGLVRFRDTDFYVNLDRLDEPPLGSFVEIKSRTWSRRDAENKSKLILELAELLGVSTQDAEGREYVKIVDEAPSPN